MYGGKYDALATSEDSKESRIHAYLFEIISSRDCFYIAKLCPPNFTADCYTSWSCLSCRVRSSFPEQGVTCHIILHSAEVRYFTHKGPRPCCTTRRSFLSTSWVWGPVVGPNHSPCFSAHRMPTHYCMAGLPLTFYHHLGRIA